MRKRIDSSRLREDLQAASFQAAQNQTGTPVLPNVIFALGACGRGSSMIFIAVGKVAVGQLQHSRTWVQTDSVAARPI